jgi:uncharacterized membrane protein
VSKPESRHGRRSRRVSHHRVQAVRTRLAEQLTPAERLAHWLTRLAGTTGFLLGHAVWFAVWILWNLGLLGTRPFDPFPFGLLTMVVSLEAIFLSIFVLMTQSRESRIAELREEITLEVDVRVEQEVTKILQLVAGLYGRLGFEVSREDTELQEMLQPLDQDEIERELSEQIEKEEPRGASREGRSPKRRGT